MAWMYVELVAAVLVTFYVCTVLKYELQMLQQNSYRIERYLRWLKSDLGAMRRWTDLLLLGVLMIFGAKAWSVS